MIRFLRSVILLFMSMIFFLTNNLNAQNQMQRAIHMGGNWGENRLRGIANQPEDYYTFLRATSVNWAGISIGLRVDHSMDSTVERDYNEQLMVPTFSDQSLRDAIRGFKNRNIKVMLSLVVDSDAGQHPQYPFFKWQTGDPYAYQTDQNIKPENWPWDPAHPLHNSFVSSYWRTYAKEAAYFAKIAQEENADMFTIGAEADRLFRTRIGGQFPNEYKNYIKALVDSVKKYYTGILTYEQHWSPLVDQTGFGPAIDNIWEDVGLDAIGISAYFRLVEPEPTRVFTVAELEAAWNNIFNNHLIPLKNRHPNLPIHFLEFGYVDVIQSLYFADTDSFKPFVFKDNDGNGLDDGQEQQANAYEAFFKVNEANNRLVQSTFMWDIMIASDADWAAGHGNMRIHTFRGKLSENIIRNWYGQYTPLPSVPSLVSPGNNSQNIPIENLILNWNDANEATSYHLQISKDANFSNMIIDDQNIFQSNFTYAQILFPNSTYWWRIKSKNAAGESALSPTFSFTTVTMLPSVPQPFEPINGAVNIQANPKLKWHCSNYVVNYELEVSSKSDFSSIFYSNSSAIDTVISLTNLQSGEKYYWRVRAKNSAGSSNWSATYSFTVIPLIPTAPLLIEPINGAVDVPVTAKLKWRHINEADSYIIQISTQSNFSPIYFTNDLVTDTIITLTNLPNSTLFYWRIGSKNTAGTSGWSQVFSFTTVNPVGVKVENPIITEFKLYQNYPNPFNPTTTINYQILGTTHVVIQVYDILGNKISTLIDKHQAVGRYTVEFDASNIASGIYIYKLTAGKYIETKKMVLRK